MPEQYITIGKACFASSTTYTDQQYTMWYNKYDVPEFSRWAMTVSLFYSSISDT